MHNTGIGHIALFHYIAHYLIEQVLFFSHHCRAIGLTECLIKLRNVLKAQPVEACSLRAAGLCLHIDPITEPHVGHIGESIDVVFAQLCGNRGHLIGGDFILEVNFYAWTRIGRGTAFDHF